jgi:hypothetical protein
MPAAVIAPSGIQSCVACFGVGEIYKFYSIRHVPLSLWLNFVKVF